MITEQQLAYMRGFLDARMRQKEAGTDILVQHLLDPRSDDVYAAQLRDDTNQAHNKLLENARNKYPNNGPLQPIPARPPSAHAPTEAPVAKSPVNEPFPLDEDAMRQMLHPGGLRVQDYTNALRARTNAARMAFPRPVGPRRTAPSVGATR